MACPQMSTRCTLVRFWSSSTQCLTLYSLHKFARYRAPKYAKPLRWPNSLTHIGVSVPHWAKSNEQSHTHKLSLKLLIHAKQELTHWGRVTQICVSKLTIIGSDNGLSPGRRQAIIWIHAGILLIRTSGTNFNEILIEIQTFWLKKIR